MINSLEPLRLCEQSISLNNTQRNPYFSTILIEDLNDNMPAFNDEILNSPIDQTSSSQVRILYTLTLSKQKAQSIIISLEAEIENIVPKRKFTGIPAKSPLHFNSNSRKTSNTTENPTFISYRDKFKLKGNNHLFPFS